MSNPPKGNDEFARLFEEMADLLQFTLENADKPLKEEMPKDLEKRLTELEKDVDSFCQINEALIEKSKREGKEVEDLEHLSKREKQVLERAKKLVEQAEEKQEELTQKMPPKPNFDDKERRKRIKRMNRKKI